MVDIFIKNASWIATLQNDRKIIRNGSIAIEDGIIASVTKTTDLGGNYQNAEFIVDGTNKLVIPGLVDGHVHCVQQLGKGLADDTNVFDMLYERLFPLEASLTEKEAYFSSLLSQLEMIKSGTTCFFDPGSYHPEQVVKALEKSGLRALVARCARDIPLSENDKLSNENAEQAYKRGEEFVRQFTGTLGGRVRGSFSLRLLYDCSDELCRKTAELAAKYNTIIQTHADADKKSVETSVRRHGASGLERIKKLGMLGVPILMIHMGGIPNSALPMMRDSNLKGVSCPVAAAHSGGSTSPYLPEMLDLGIQVCFGSDSAGNNNCLDVTRAMNFAALSTKRDRSDATILKPEQLLEMATLNAAKIASWDSELGSIEVGKKADISIFNTARPEWVPVNNPIASLVYSGTGSSADTVIVDGRLLMLNRKVVTLDEEALVEEAFQRGTELASRLGLDKKAGSSWPMV